MKKNKVINLAYTLLKKNNIRGWNIRVVKHGEMDNVKYFSSWERIQGQIDRKSKEIRLWEWFVTHKSLYANTENILHEIAHIILPIPSIEIIYIDKWRISIDFSHNFFWRRIFQNLKKKFLSYS